MEPARTIIERLGGVAIVSKIAGVAYTAPYRWQYAKERGGTGGLIPQRHIPDLLAYARQNGIDLTADDFFVAPSSAPSDPPPASESVEAQP